MSKEPAGFPMVALVPIIIQIILAAAILFAPAGFDHAPEGGFDFGDVLVVGLFYMLSLVVGLIISYMYSSIVWWMIQLAGFVIVASTVFYQASGAGLPRNSVPPQQQFPGQPISN